MCLLSEANASLELGGRNVTPLMKACLRGETAIACVLLEAGASLDRTDQSGNTAIIIAADAGRGRIVNLLLS